MHPCRVTDGLAVSLPAATGCDLEPAAATLVEAGCRLLLQNVDAQHPPHKEQCDDGDDHVSNPLFYGLRFG